MDSVVGFGLFFGLLALALVGTLALAIRRGRESLRRLEEWARHNDWRVVRNPRVDWTPRLPGRNAGGVRLLLHGSVHERPVAVADYSYWTGGSSSGTSTTYRFVVIAVGLPVPHPELAVVRRDGLSRLGRSLFGGRAAEVGVPAFDREFRVRTRHPELVPSIVGPALVEEHLAGRLPEWSLAGRELLTWRPGELLSEPPPRIPQLVEPLVRVAELLGR
jgi:hypothetical protein